MKDLKSEFSLPIKGLIDGLHQYAFELKDSFFDMYEESLVKKGLFTIQLQLEKKPSLIVLNFDCVGALHAPCDRCLKQIEIPVEAQEQYLVKFSDEEINGEDVVFIQRDTSHINVADMMNELIHLHLPLINTRDCESEEYKDCDEDMLLYLNPDDTPGTEESGNDIWGELKNIKLK